MIVESIEEHMMYIHSPMSKLKKYRQKLNLTQKELAQSTNISIRTIQRIEAGQQPKGHTLKATNSCQTLFFFLSAMRFRIRLNETGVMPSA